MDEVLPGLWVGGVRAAMDADYLCRAGVTHIITCMKQQIPTPPPLADGRSITRAEMKHVRIDDEEKAPILVHFAGCNDFITSQLEEEWVADFDDDPTQAAAAEEEGDSADEVELLVQGRQKRNGKWGSWQTTGAGTVLVHCQAGCSRSVAIVAAYLMHTRRISSDTAVGMIKRRRADAGPNRGFLAQLELYEQVGFEIDMKWQAVRRFLMSKTDILNGDSTDDMLLSYYPSPYPSPALSAAGGMRAFTSITSDSNSDGGVVVTSTNSSVERESKTKISNHQPKSLSRSASSSSTSSNSSSIPRISLLSSITPDSDGDSDDSSSLPNISARLSGMSTSAGASTISDTTAEVKVTANSSGRLPGGVTQIRGHEGANNRGSLAKPNFAGPKLRCKGCRRELAALDHVVIHEPGKGQLAFEHRRRDVGHSGQNVATDSSGSIGPVDEDEKTSGEAEFQGTIEATTTVARTTTTASSADKVKNGVQAQDTAASTTIGEVATAAAAPPSTKRPIQSAASLASQLPPHLAALRGNRPHLPTK
uniref:protein-tyrosine-phosphatase n=1 Tax=Melanopsichium pennsylvanicum 4 TaxID=1398559 RepID=A0A077R986_9BASI|nr:related to Tyrosine specific protein phosphatase and dual specificity protein phosphatase [Melanopsichium pennsylvanicum 4]